MTFLCLCESELEGIKVNWAEGLVKSPELIDSALAAGFTRLEIAQSPLGALEEEYRISAIEIAKVGAVVLMGMNGSILLEIVG